YGTSSIGPPSTCEPPAALPISAVTSRARPSRPATSPPTTSSGTPITSTSKQTSKSFRPNDPRGIRPAIGLVATVFPPCAPAQHDAQANICRRDQGKMSTETALSGGVHSSICGGGGSDVNASTNAAPPASAQANEKSRAVQSYFVASASASPPRATSACRRQSISK